MKDRQNALYEYLLEKGEKWTPQIEVARDLFEHFGNGECCLEPKEYHDSFERTILSRTISDINFSRNFEKIVISSAKGIKIANEEEHRRYVMSLRKSALRKLARVYIMAKKGNLNGQIDFGGHTFESFLESVEK